MSCEFYDPDNIFRRFKVVEFPISFAGLSTTRELDVETDLYTSAYLKTTYEGHLMKFDDARNISATHRAFTVDIKSNHVITITFIPKNECISKAKHDNHFDNRFVFDLRLIKVDGSRCCYNELHSEIGRYYISGQFEYCKIHHSPDIVDFGDVLMNTKATKFLRIRNESNILSAKMQYIKIVGFEIVPETFTLPPNKSKKVALTIRPTCLKLKNMVTFKLINPHDVFDDNIYKNENFISYPIHFKLNVICKKNSKEIHIESLHKLSEKNPDYTYIGKELITHNKRQKQALDYLEVSKKFNKNIPILEKYTTEKNKCLSNILIDTKRINFCQKIKEAVPMYDLFQIQIIPISVNFGKVGKLTYGENIITIRNNTKFEISMEFLKDKFILYSETKKTTLNIKLKSFAQTTLTIFSVPHIEGYFTDFFQYRINETFYRKQNYSIQIDTPTLMVNEKCLKFGMITTENFVTSVPIKIFNNFNVNVNFKWEEIQADVPFEITPNSGTIPRHSSRICDIQYICKNSKTKTHEVNLLAISDITRHIPIELSVITRKLSIKFIQNAVTFKDIGLNLETTENVKLENSSRELALFHIVEPLIPGLKIEPMCGTIRPKMIMSFNIIVKIPCILEFAYDICVKINNKENVILPVSGNVVQPKLIIHPKNLYMARIPCYMITFIPVTFQNLSTIKTIIEVLDTGDDNIFGVYILQGNERKRIFEFTVEGGQTRTIFVKVHGIFRREYEMYMPFKINGLLGPPNHNNCTTELQYYTEEYEKAYKNNSKVKIKTINTDISFCRLTGVITVPWIKFSVEKFEIEFDQNAENFINFSMNNVSKCYLYVTILISKLAPSFTLNFQTEDILPTINENHIKFELNCGQSANFILKFHPKGHGKFVSTALLYLDKAMSIPYYNLTFTGKRQVPVMYPSAYQIIFAPCRIGEEVSRLLTLKMEGQSNKESFSCNYKEESHLIIEFIDSDIELTNHTYFTTVRVKITALSDTNCARNIVLNFQHENGSECKVEVSFNFTYCPLTLHTQFLAKQNTNPYPYYPLDSQTELFNYMETCKSFLEKWMFQQGFRRDLFPIIPDTFHAISSSITSQPGDTKSRGIKHLTNITYLNFVRRIAGPLMKHVRKVAVTGVDESFKYVKEVHDTYREILSLLKSRGANLWVLQAKFLLSYEQFVTYCENVTSKHNADIILTQQLIANKPLFDRLNKQSWIDFILQSYKVFVMDSCFFECVCTSTQPKDIIKIIIDWYNENISKQHLKLRNKTKSVKVVTNITTGLSDGIALISTIINYCPFMSDHFQPFCDTNENTTIDQIINNGSLVIEAMNILRIYFPLNIKDLLEPNFLQMLFLSIHLYIVLPTFKPRDVVEFNPPLLRSSTRQLSISSSSQESLIFNYVILNNKKTNFSVEKGPTTNNGKKIHLNVKYTANFVAKEMATLLVQSYNKTRVFDTYIVFILHGNVGILNPFRKCKVTGPLYRPNKVDVLIASPFLVTANYKLYLTDNEPEIPVGFEENSYPKYYVKRLQLIDKEISLNGLPQENGQEIQEQKLYLQMICLSTQIGNSWLWFRSDIGEFFIRIITQPRWDLAIDTIQGRVHMWPLDPCSCGETCECYRTTAVMIPHRNELMLKSLRYSLIEEASEVMIEVFDKLIESATGKIILLMLLKEGGTNLSEVQHILRYETTYRISSSVLLPRLDKVTLAQHTLAFLALPVTIPSQERTDKYFITLTSECGMDIRTYRILFIGTYSE